MSLLAKATKPSDRAIVCTITGDPGIGKTTLANLFPGPVFFLRTEDGLQSIPSDQRPDTLDVVKDVKSLWEQMTALAHEDHPYKTVVIDSVTVLERMFIQHVVDQDPKKPKSINQALGGYGAGLAAVAGMHQAVRRGAQMINDRGINVVFIAHSDTVTIELPDQDPYTRYDLRLGKRSVAPYCDDVDMVSYVKLEMFTKGDGERKKAVSDGTRVIVCHTCASNISKNRFGISEDVSWPNPTVNPLEQYIPALQSN